MPPVGKVLVLVGEQAINKSNAMVCNRYFIGDEYTAVDKLLILLNIRHVFWSRRNSMRRSIFISFLFLLVTVGLTAQSASVRLKGKVVDAQDGTPLVSLMAVDKESGSGTFGDGDGEFVLNMTRGKVLLVGAIGYETISFKVPLDHESAVLSKTFYLRKLVIDLPEIEIIPERELVEIQEDINDLGYNANDYQLSGINANASPITFLYQKFSKRERSIRLVAELENDDRRRDLLKELFQRYIDYDIIELEDDEFDDFIDYCNVSDYFLQNSSQYDFLVFVKRRFGEYQRSPTWIKHKAIDDEYYRK